MKIELNADFKKALRLIEEENKHLFITGRAGTGKSTFLSYLRDHTPKNMVFLAPTGVAAVNIKGQTIHSFFRFKPDITQDKIKKTGAKRGAVYKKLDAIVIDEISMVRADLLDCVDTFMRLNGRHKSLPFGGAQMIFIGDLYQLPPVVTGAEREIFKTKYDGCYFFNAKVFNELEMGFVELEKIYRQSDSCFIELLNAIRNNSVTDEQLALLNSRRQKGTETDGDDDFSIYLTTTNKTARQINETKMAGLPGKPRRFRGVIEGDFESKYLPTDETLQIKIGAQIMLLNNDAEGRWVNGSVGKVVDLTKYRDDPVIIAKLEDGDLVEITPFTWKLFRFKYDKDGGRLVSENIGSFTQFPLAPAWAITIHKSQGKTFKKVVLDIGRGTFAHGQVYVALSRCTSLEGLTLIKPLQKKHIFMDWRVVKFMTLFRYNLADKEMPLDEKIAVIEAAIAAEGELKITYLKGNDIKSERIIRPLFVGELEYLGRTFTGVSALDSKSGGKRNFRVDRILSLEVSQPA